MPVPPSRSALKEKSPDSGGREREGGRDRQTDRQTEIDREKERKR